jgi:hypothetical protein
LWKYFRQASIFGEVSPGKKRNTFQQAIESRQSYTKLYKAVQQRFGSVSVFVSILVDETAIFWAEGDSW